MGDRSLAVGAGDPHAEREEYNLVLALGVRNRSGRAINRDRSGLRHLAGTLRAKKRHGETGETFAKVHPIVAKQGATKLGKTPQNRAVLANRDKK